MGWFRWISLYILYCYLQITRKKSVSDSLRLDTTLVTSRPLYCAETPQCWICPFSIVEDSGNLKEPEPLLIWKVPHCLDSYCNPTSPSVCWWQIDSGAINFKISYVFFSKGQYLRIITVFTLVISSNCKNIVIKCYREIDNWSLRYILKCSPLFNVR